MNHAWVVGGTIGAVTTLGLLVAGMLGSIVVGLPAAVFGGWAYRRVERARLIRAMGPALSASKGELPAAGHEPELGEDFHIGSSRNTPPHGGF